MFNSAFKQFDEDNNGALSHHEWRTANKEYKKMMKKMLGDDAPDFSPGEDEFFWMMSNSVKNGGWNEWGRHRRGVSKADQRRLNRILRRDYKDIIAWEAEHGDDSDSDDDKEEAATDTDFLLL